MTREDCLSREAVLDTLDTTDKFLDEDRTVENYKALLKECYEVLTPVTPPSEDCVSRQALINAFPISDTYTLDDIIATIKFQPPVTPIRKKGKWVANHDESDDSHTIDCSCCGYTLIRVVNRGFTAEEALDCVKDKIKNYCLKCGAEMEEEE